MHYQDALYGKYDGDRFESIQQMLLTKTHDEPNSKHVNTDYAYLFQVPQVKGLCGWMFRKIDGIMNIPLDQFVPWDHLNMGFFIQAVQMRFVLRDVWTL